MHPQRGAIFEIWVVSEIYKGLSHNGQQPRLFHYREARGPEIDFLIDQGRNLAAVEIKSGATISHDFFDNLNHFTDRMAQADDSRAVACHVVYGGETDQQRSRVRVLSWRHVERLIAG
ncbi:MAG: DUF4143 domain-containing protein [Desulfatirhabdiaceae bacterium]